MLPRLVGGADDSLTARFLLSRFTAEFHDQLPNASPLPVPPLENGGGGGVAGRDSD